MYPRIARLVAAASMLLAWAAPAWAERLTVATDTAFVPFEFKQDGKYVGFDIDLWAAIAAEAGLDYALQPMDFNGIIPALQTGRVDVAIAGMTIKAEREKVVDFSHPYYRTSVRILVRADSDIAGPADLAGRTVAVKTGTTSVDIAQGLDAGEIRRFPNIDAAYAEVRLGRAEAAIYDTPNLRHYVNTVGGDAVKIVGPDMEAQTYGIAFPQGSPLRERVNIALLTLMEDGRYDAIHRKWFGAPDRP